MTEEQINNVLRIGLKAYKDLNCLGYKNEAHYYLVLTSELAKFYLKTSDIKTHRPICSTCGLEAKNNTEAEFIRGIGECASCDHIRGEVLGNVS